VAVVDGSGGYGFAQLQPGDIIQSINGRPVNSINDLRAVLGNVRQRGWQMVIKRGNTLLQMAIQQ
jgi:S1-C subfamily serine protease